MEGNKMQPNVLGELLIKLRGKKSLRDVANETGLSHSYIRDIEKGYRRASDTPIKPSPDALKKLSKAYHYPYDELMKKAGYIPEDFDHESLEQKISRDPELRVIFRAIENLSESDKIFLRDLIERVFPNAFKEIE